MRLASFDGGVYGFPALRPSAAGPLEAVSLLTPIMPD